MSAENPANLHSHGLQRLYVSTVKTFLNREIRNVEMGNRKLHGAFIITTILLSLSFNKVWMFG